MEQLNYDVCQSYPTKLFPGHMGRGGGGGVEGEGEGGATLLYYRGSTSSMCHFLIPMDCLQPWTCTVYGLRRYILRCVPICLFRGTFRHFLGEDPSSTTRFLNY